MARQTKNKDTGIYEFDSKNKQDAYNALLRKRGIISHAAEAIGITRQTIHNWLNDDPLFKQAYDQIREAAIDHLESKLFEVADGVLVQGKDDVYFRPPDTSAIIFGLKTLGKKRGYVERQEIAHDLPEGFEITISKSKQDEE